MKIAQQEYTKESFIAYITDPTNKVFEDEERRRWLKIYCLLVSEEGWREKFASKYNVVNLGQVAKLTPKFNIEDFENDEVYYLVEHPSGLLLLYTTATNEEFHSSLGRLIDKTRGITRMWTKPEYFKAFWKKVISEPNRIMYRFTSRRSMYDENPSQIRPDFDRRFNYTGNDGNITAEELEELYGVIPDSVYITVSENLTIHADNNGLFSVQYPSTKAFAFFDIYLNLLIDKSLALKELTQSIKYEVVQIEQNAKSISFDSASIILKHDTFDEDLVKRLQKQMENFSFIGAHLTKGSLSFTATVVDNLKRSVFDVDFTESEISIVPKYQATFESYISFFKNIVELVDSNAEMVLVE